MKETCILAGKIFSSRSKAKEYVSGILRKYGDLEHENGLVVDTKPASREAQTWAGFGTSLKPAHEDWWLFRKPLACKTIAENVLEWGCGGLNIDGCRIGTSDNLNGGGYSSGESKGMWTPGKEGGDFGRLPGEFEQPPGRFPSNLIWSHSPLCKRIGTKKVKGNAHYSYKPTNDGVYKLGLGQLDDLGNPLAGADGMETVESWDCHPSCPSWQFAKAGESKSIRSKRGGATNGNGKNIDYGEFNKLTGYECGYQDAGSPARFFQSCPFTEEDIPAFAYVAKASRAERDKGLIGKIPITKAHSSYGEYAGTEEHTTNANSELRNGHPTVKPLELMKYLIRLVTPPNGIILDPFAGSGTTLLAAKQEGFRFLGIEKEAEYCDICRKRIAAIPASLDKWL